MVDADSFITCWCGAVGDVDELFDDLGLEEACGGTGRVNCFCGGDQCVCHYHGETECPGCEDCKDCEIEDPGDREGSDCSDADD